MSIPPPPSSPSGPFGAPSGPAASATPVASAQRPSAPNLVNGATVHGILGQNRLRHPFEIPLVVLASLVTLNAYLGWFLILVLLAIPGTRKETWEVLVAAPVLVQIGMIVMAMPLILWIGRALMYAQARASAVRMTPNQFPEGYRMLAEAAEQFGLRRVPDAYVVLGNGVINAFASGHGFRRTVVVHSDLFEVGGAARDPEALRFVIAHEVGHLAAGHVSYFRLVLTNLAYNVPILGKALSRAQEYTADNFGYAHEPGGSVGAMALLSGGKYLNAEVNVNELADRAATEKGLWVHLVHWTSTHPVLTWRAHALRDRSRPGKMFIRPGLLGGSANLFEGPLPAGSSFSKGYPTPGDVLAMLDQADALRAPGTAGQFGRFPGQDQSGRPAMRAMQLAQPVLSRPAGTAAEPAPASPPRA